MVKATLRSAVLLGIAAIGVLAAGMPSFAEVQNVKVGGDITVRAFHRENLDLHAQSGAGATGGGVGAVNATQGQLDGDNFLMSTVGINVGADLTENISAFIRIANERDWNQTANTAAGDFDISQAYVAFKELFYSPLTVSIGQQPIVWGRGFVLGSNLLPGTLLGGADDRNASINANEYTDFTAFDAIRATIDLSSFTGNVPLTADYVYIKLDETLVGEDDDQTAQGLNFSTKFDMGEAEAYYLSQNDESPVGNGGAEDGRIHTLGLRSSAKPVEGAYLYGELAYQWGNRVTDLEGVQASGGGHAAWAANLGAEYTLTGVAMNPMFGAEWRFYSGNECSDTGGNAVNGACAGWQAIAPGYFRTAIREFQTRRSVTGFYATQQNGVTSGQTNQHELGLYTGFNPLEDLRVGSRLSWFILPVGAVPPTSPAGVGGNRNSFIGTEWDTQFTYDYTDDVQFGFLYALFLPGNVFRDAGGIAGTAAAIGGDATAQQLVITVSVKF